MNSIWANSTVLALEASTGAGSVALWVDGAPVGMRAVQMGAGREDLLFPAICDLLSDAALSPSALHAIVCGEGPGSFTSLRIAAALAKGLAHGVGCALYAVPSLLIAAASLSSDVAPGRMLVHSDALRGERYVLPVERDAMGRTTRAGAVARLAVAELEAMAAGVATAAVGDAVLHGEPSIVPSVERLPLVTGDWQSAPVDLSAWEPAYGRLAEAQVKWEATHGTALPAS